MKRKRKLTGIPVLIVLGLWFLWAGKVSASGMFFPFVADDWILIDSDISSVYSGNQNGGETLAKETMAVPVNYDQKITPADREILYKVVSQECDTCYEGSLAVISCMLNRMESGKYPDDLMDVVTEKAQFTAYYDRNTGTYPYLSRKPSKECIAAVDDALAGKRRNLPSYILYFRSSDYNSLKGYKKYGKIGDNTYFYKEADR
ncbi:MAG: cell wall hydrolase [Lachnospiraceae bacterium]|nr:cell wall hydrolase [Lachnospiraceae bacterium]MDD7210680.1 cell wall hydrolase [Lachnospiraceae bacterium]MDY5497642.1 cell wall hydrolase [Anaerobutyricum sp.]